VCIQNILYVVSEALNSSTTSVYVEHLADDHVSVASIIWPEYNADATYVLEINPAASLTFDEHFPVRPTEVRLHDDSNESVRTQLTGLIGTNIVAALVAAKTESPLVLQTSLDALNRISIAKLQFESQATPAHLKLACLALLEEQRRLYLSEA
jgi:hypothetical protein